MEGVVAFPFQYWNSALHRFVVSGLRLRMPVAPAVLTGSFLDVDVPALKPEPPPSVDVPIVPTSEWTTDILKMYAVPVAVSEAKQQSSSLETLFAASPVTRAPPSNDIYTSLFGNVAPEHVTMSVSSDDPLAALSDLSFMLLRSCASQSVQAEVSVPASAVGTDALHKWDDLSSLPALPPVLARDLVGVVTTGRSSELDGLLDLSFMLAREYRATISPVASSPAALEHPVLPDLAHMLSRVLLDATVSQAYGDEQSLGDLPDLSFMLSRDLCASPAPLETLPDLSCILARSLQLTG